MSKKCVFPVQGKEHKKYEFGSKASVVMTKTSGVIVSAVAHAENLYDGDALRPPLEQTKAITGESPAKANRYTHGCVRGFDGGD